MRDCSRAFSHKIDGGSCESKVVHVQVARIYFSRPTTPKAHTGTSCFCRSEDGCNSNDWSMVFSGLSNGGLTSDSIPSQTTIKYEQVNSTYGNYPSEEEAATVNIISLVKDANGDGNSALDKYDPDEEISTVITANSAGRCPFDFWTVILSNWMYYIFYLFNA